VISVRSGELLTRTKAEKANPRRRHLRRPDATMFDAEPISSRATNQGGRGLRPLAVGKDDKYYGFSTNFQAFIVNTR